MRRPIRRVDGNDAFVGYLRVLGDELPEPKREYRFDSKRKWRFDFAWPSQLVAVEIDGGAWVAGRHVRGSGFEADCEKMNMAALLGWHVLRFTPQMLQRDPIGCMAIVRTAIEEKR